MSGFLQRRLPASTSAPRVPSARDEEIARLIPFLIGHLSDESYADGTSRLTSSLTVFTDAGVLKAVLNDRQEGESLWVASVGLWSLLEALEGNLREGTGDWRLRKDQTGKQRRRR